MVAGKKERLQNCNLLLIKGVVCREESGRDLFGLSGLGEIIFKCCSTPLYAYYISAF